MKITKKIVREYLKNPDSCPFCNNKKGSGLLAFNNDITPDVNVLWRDVKCKDCNRIWTEQFRLEVIDNLIEQ